MIEFSTLTIFASAALLLLIIPGPAVLYIVARSIEQGRVAGLVSTLGITIGTLVHVAAAAFGLSAILMTSAMTFNIVKYAGAAYLVVLGIKTILSAKTPANTAVVKKESMRKILVQGILVNVLNPKTALFFFAFLPQFVDVSKGNATAQILLLGTILVGLGVVSDGLYAMLSGTIGNWLQRKPNLLNIQRYVSGGVLITLGIAAALTGSKK